MITASVESQPGTAEIAVVEQITIDARLTDEEQKRFDANSGEIFREILEERGFEVNNVIVSREVDEMVALSCVAWHISQGPLKSYYLVKPK